MSARRLYAPVVLALLLVGVLAFVASSRTWASATVQAQGLLPDDIAVTGRDVAPAAAALALVVGASALAVLAASVRVRRAVGVLTVLVSLGAVVLVLSADVLGSAWDQAVSESTAFTGHNAPHVVVASPWRLVTVGLFVVAALLGAVVAALAGRWPTMGRRYDAPAAHATPAQAPVEEASGADLWKALDEGKDPTQ